MGTLVLTLNQFNRLKIGEDIYISVPSKTRVFIEAPSGVNIEREKTPNKEAHNYDSGNKTSFEAEKKNAKASVWGTTQPR